MPATRNSASESTASTSMSPVPQAPKRTQASKHTSSVDPKLSQKINHLVGRCIKQWKLIEDGDHILVGVSGGKDSYVLLDVLMRMQRIAPIQFEITAFHLDQGQPGFQTHLLERHLKKVGVRYVIHHQDTYSIVMEKLAPGKTTCSLCSRLRRGIMYNQAVELGCNKIALGHHRDDVIETLLLNIFYSGQLKSMPAKLHSDDGRNTVIRPLLNVPEKLLVEYAKQAGFPIIPCTLCSRQPDMKRDAMTALIDGLEAENSNIRGNLFAALRNVVPSHLLDPSLFDPNGDLGASVSAEELMDEMPI